MTNKEALTAVLAESRNGMNHAYRASLLYSMLMSDGVKEVCEAAGCFWLMDILGTEVAPKLMRDVNAGKQASVFVEVSSAGGKCTIKVTDTDDGPAYFTRKIPHTDFPEGKWNLFEMGPASWDDNGRTTKIICTLITEH